MISIKKLLTAVIACLLIAVPAMCTDANAAAVYTTGDVDGDGEISSADCLLIQSYLAKQVSLSSQQVIAADVNNDGSVGITDVTLIQQYLAGMISCLPKDCSIGMTLSSDRWITTSPGSYKNFSIVCTHQWKYKIEYENGIDWINITKNNNNLKVSLSANTSTYTRGATIYIISNSKKSAITIKQLGNISTGDAYSGYAACYGYALKLTADPRGENGRHATIFTQELPCKPGALSDDPDYSYFNIEEFSYSNYGQDFFNRFVKHIMEYVDADMKALGWNFEKVTSANHKVRDGNWLVALSFNPYETIWATNGGYPIYSFDYHWYRRIDNINGTSYWSNKHGTYPVQSLGNKLPENECISLNSYIQSRLLNDNTDRNSASFRYIFVGYYEVGPN